MMGLTGFEYGSKRVSTNSDVKIANAVKIYTELRGSGGMSKSELANRVHLSFASVSNMCTTLEQSGLVKVTDNVRSTGGRKAAMVQFVPDFACSLVIDMHHTQHIYMGLLDLENRLEDYTRFEVSPDDTLETVLDHITLAYNQLCGGRKRNLLGVSIGISAVLDPKTGMVLQSSNPIFERVQLPRYLTEVFPNTVVLVENDANLAGLSNLSLIMKTDPSIKNLLFIFFTQGIGLGIVIDQKLYRGTNGFAGELGHLKVSGISKVCKCGGTGCLRTVATLESIAQDLGEIDKVMSLESTTIYAADLARRYAAGETAVVKRVDLTALKIGEVMADLFDLFNPQEIILGGNMSELFPHISQTIKQQCRALSNLAREVDLMIRFVSRTTYELVLTGGSEKLFQFWVEHFFPEIPSV